MIHIEQGYKHKSSSLFFLIWLHFNWSTLSNVLPSCPFSPHRQPSSPPQGALEDREHHHGDGNTDHTRTGPLWLACVEVRGNKMSKQQVFLCFCFALILRGSELRSRSVTLKTLWEFRKQVDWGNKWHGKRVWKQMCLWFFFFFSFITVFCFYKKNIVFTAALMLKWSPFIFPAHTLAIIPCDYLMILPFEYSLHTVLWPALIRGACCELHSTQREESYRKCDVEKVEQLLPPTLWKMWTVLDDRSRVALSPRGCEGGVSLWQKA